MNRKGFILLPILGLVLLFGIVILFIFFNIKKNEHIVPPQKQYETTKNTSTAPESSNDSIKQYTNDYIQKQINEIEKDGNAKVLRLASFTDVDRKLQKLYFKCQLPLPEDFYEKIMIFNTQVEYVNNQYFLLVSQHNQCFKEDAGLYFPLREIAECSDVIKQYESNEKEHTKLTTIAEEYLNQYCEVEGGLSVVSTLGN